MFVARLIVPKIRILLHRLTDPRHIAVTEDAPHPCEERQFTSVAFHNLVLQKQNQRLGHRQSALVHHIAFSRHTNGTRGSFEFQVWRTQA